jgi:hypothetical protein
MVVTRAVAHAVLVVTLPETMLVTPQEMREQTASWVLLERKGQKLPLV